MSDILMVVGNQADRAKTGEDELKSQIKKKQVMSRASIAKSSRLVWQRAAQRRKREKRMNDDSSVSTLEESSRSACRLYGSRVDFSIVRC